MGISAHHEKAQLVVSKVTNNSVYYSLGNINIKGKIMLGETEGSRKGGGDT